MKAVINFLTNLGVLREEGTSLIARHNQVYVDGVNITDNLLRGQREVHIHKIEVTGNLVELEVGSGDVNVRGNVTGNIKTGSGDVLCCDVGGNVTTGSGDVDANAVAGSVKTGSGNIEIGM